MPFLTELDERAEVKGSRDPLGLVPIWSKFGRDVVGNLTTVTGSVRGFTTLLLGLELADMLRDRLRSDALPPIETFLRFEQLAGYARYKCHHDTQVRGNRRIAARINNGARIRISAESRDQILSNQKIYGLWGLFTVPARSSGLLESGASRLTSEARGFLERQYFSMLGNAHGVNQLLKLLARVSFDLQPNGRDVELLEKIERIHSRQLRAQERDFYRQHLAWGGKGDTTRGKQRALAEILCGINTHEFGFPEFRLVQKKARNGNQALFVSLEKIDRLERLIAPAALLFGFLQNRDRQSTSLVAKQIAETWQRPLHINLTGIRELQTEISATLQSAPEAQLWMDLSEAFASAEYMRVIELLVAINTSVMQRRHGAASWIVIEGGKLKVHLADERAELLPVNEAENYWRSTYFINSLWRIAREVSA